MQMNMTGQIAEHLREVYFGGNWTSVNIKDNLVDISWQQATTQVYSFNTIAALVYHINYYISAVLNVLKTRSSGWDITGEKREKMSKE